MKITLIKNLNGLFVPAFDSDKEIANKIKVNQAIQVNFTKPRNYLFHKKYFALLNLAYNNFETDANFEEFRKEIIMRAGFYTVHTNFKGVKVYEAESISFANMKSKKFEELYSKSLDVILKYVLKGNTKKEIEQELINFM